jgi:hypothetical protein
MKRVLLSLLVLLSFQVAPADASPCETEPTDMSVAYGDQIICDTDPTTDTDLFRFTGTAGDRILAEALFVSGTSYVPRIQLVAPNGVVLTNTFSPARADLVLPQTGTYTAVIFSHASSAVGSYAFTVSCTSGTCSPTPPPPPTPAPGGDIECEPEPSDMFPHYGTRVTCDISPTTDTDLFRFVASAGDRILAEAVFVSGASFVPRIELIAPDGTVLTNTFSPARSDVLLNQTGVYTAIVFSHAATASGRYAFTVSCTAGRCLPPGAGPILTLTLTGCTICATGNQFTVVAHWQNTRASAVATEVKVGLRLPDGTPFNMLGDEHFQFAFPASLDFTGTLFDFAWPDLPPGTWTIEAAVLGPALGETFSRDVKTFTVTAP